MHLPHLPHLDGHRLYIRAQHAAHLMYFGMVFIEGHTVYANIAGYLFISTAIGFLLHEDVV